MELFQSVKTRQWNILISLISLPTSSAATSTWTDAAMPETAVLVTAVEVAMAATSTICPIRTPADRLTTAVTVLDIFPTRGHAVSAAG